LVAVTIGPTDAVVTHIGDGAVVLRLTGNNEWIVPSWPFHGQYASTTRFVIDDPQATINVINQHGKYDRFAAFSDGIEYLVLDHQNKAAPAELFDGFVAPLTQTPAAGRDRAFSKRLRAYLASDKIREATDDDISLVLGIRP
jgi:hypothetical protein